jgi:hypothetical protein
LLYSPKHVGASDKTYFGISVKKLDLALAAWRSGHRIRLRNEKTLVQIPPGYKVLGET